MAKLTRKAFLSYSALLAGAMSIPRMAWGRRTGFDAVLPDLPQSRGSGMEPDAIVVNARAHTMDAAAPDVDAFAIKDGRFQAVGRSADIRNMASARTQVFDAQQMTVLPGFTDCHCHPSGVGELYEANANVRTLAELQSNLRKKAAESPPGQWVNGFMFDDTKFDTVLNRRHLDAVSTSHPIGVHHRGGHTSWYNTRALDLAGITGQTPDPEHGRFFRENGDLTGRVAERARQVFDKVGTEPTYTPEQERERNRNGMRFMSEWFASVGLTTVHDAGAGPDKIRAYEDVYRNGELRHRAYMMIRGAYRQLRDAGVYSGFGDEWVRVGAVKYAADGSASERTMRMSTPYVGTNDYGILTMSQDDIHSAVDDAHRNNWQVGIHANGDVTIDMVLKAYERALKQWPHPDRRHRIEHCSLVNPGLLARIKATGTIPTPFWTYVYYHGEKWSQYGDEKMRWMFAHRSFLDYGIRVPGASDYNPGPFEPLMAIQSMVTRRDYRGREWGPNQKVTVDEALRIATINGAYASYEERTKGSITPGKWADFVVLAKDPHAVDPNTIKDIEVVRTVAGGRVVHPKSA
ncbi:MAG: N-substituted formamide deformylase [Gemmatimonadaceae bacterium]|nr:N-substituted formamide deformylase [Gemmatimonadaceae bacterium]